MKDLEKLSDSELVRAFKVEENDVYFEELFRRYKDKVYFKASSYAAREELAEDLTQEIFVKVFLGLKKFREEASFSTWLYKITANHCYNYLSRRKRDDLSLEPEKLGPSLSRKKNLETEIDVQSVLAKLDPEDRTILVMKYSEGYTFGEISKILGISESAAKMRAKRAKNKFSKLYHGG